MLLIPEARERESESSLAVIKMSLQSVFPFSSHVYSGDCASAVSERAKRKTKECKMYKQVRSDCVSRVARTCLSVCLQLEHGVRVNSLDSQGRDLGNRSLRATVGDQEDH